MNNKITRRLNKDVDIIAQIKEIQNHGNIEETLIALMFEDGHQHINVIYFGKLKDPNQVIKLQKEEVHNIKWFSKEDLEGDEIDEEIRITSKIALGELK